jgi:hypothetical protein
MSLMVTLYKMIKVAALNLGTPSKSAYSKDASLQLELSCIYDNIFIYCTYIFACFVVRLK